MAHPHLRALTSFCLYFVDVSYALLPVMVFSYHSSPLLLTMQCWPLARGSFISERPQKQLSDYSVHKWWSSVITTFSALASPLGFLVFTVSLPLCGGNVNYLKLRRDEVTLLRKPVEQHTVSVINLHWNVMKVASTVYCPGSMTPWMSARVHVQPVIASTVQFNIYSQTSVRELNSFLKVVRKPKLFSP